LILNKSVRYLKPAEEELAVSIKETEWGSCLSTIRPEKVQIGR
jgi:hypothetical protein